MKQLILLFGLMLSAPVFSADSIPQNPTPFSQWLKALKGELKSAGISDTTIAKALNNIELNPKVIEYDRRQPEFNQTFWSYTDKRVNDFRIDLGREKLKEHRTLLNKATQTYGIPQRFLVSFWGLETNFGRYTGKMPIIQSLVTLSYDMRRSEFFKKELIKALQIIDQGHIDAEHMLGSWAGAMGQTQFMPSTFQQYAIDGDGDGKINLWQSLPDVMISSGNFLNQLGWKRGETWGREVKLPTNFDQWELATLKHKASLAEWSQLGLTKANGNPLPSADISASLLIPAGHTGPAFLVYPNFRVIMKWNYSTNYALAVGLLADQLVYKSELSVDKPKNEVAISVETAKALQEKLNTLGFDAGTPDGIIGSMTRKALSQWQKSQGLIPDGHPSAEVIQRILN